MRRAMGVIELRRWQDDDVAAVRATQADSTEAALAWVCRQQARTLTVGVSCAIAPIGQPAAGSVGLIRRPRIEMGAAEARGKGLATSAVVGLSRWALQSAGMIRVEALLDPHNVASRRVVEKSGFRPEGLLRSCLERNGRPADALAFSMLDSDL